MTEFMEYAGTILLIIASLIGGYLGGRRGVKVGLSDMSYGQTLQDYGRVDYGERPIKNMPRTRETDISEDNEAVGIRNLLVEKFGEKVSTRSGVNDFLRNMYNSIEHLESELKQCQSQRVPGSVVVSGVGDWLAEMLRVGGRYISTSRKNLHADLEFSAFSREVGLDEVLRGLQEIRPVIAQSHDFAERDVNLLLSQNWIHFLFRAEALNGTYYPTQGAWAELRQGLVLVAASLREFMSQKGYEVNRTRLLTPLKLEEAEATRHSSKGLQSLPVVRKIVTALGGGTLGEAPMVLDCLRVGWSRRDRGQNSPAKVVVYNPADWR